MHECICFISPYPPPASAFSWPNIKKCRTPLTSQKKCKKTYRKGERKYENETNAAASHFYGSIHVTTEVSSGCWQLVVDKQLPCPLKSPPIRLPTAACRPLFYTEHKFKCIFILQFSISNNNCAYTQYLCSISN